MNKIREARNKEVALISKIFCVSIWNIGSSFLSPMIVSSVTFAGVLFLNGKMELADIMTGLYVFGIIGASIRSLPYVFNSLVETLISMERIEKFIRQEEIDYSNLVRINNKRSSEENKEETLEVKNNNNFQVDNTFNCNANQEEIERLKIQMEDISIKIDNLSFSWGKEKDESNKTKPDLKKDKNLKLNETSIVTDVNINNTLNEQSVLDHSETGKLNKTLFDYPTEEGIPTNLKNISLEIKKGEFIGIIGEVGSGKSSLLQALLNNMIILTNNSDKNKCIYINGSVSYVPQIPWIENATLKENIIFNNKYNEEFYNKVIDLCELKVDIDSLIGADQTEIGEKGINLSGGQKARVSLARAIYSNCDITILDDPISALDANVGHNIMTKLIMKELKGKTRILVTHALQYLNNCDKIYYMNLGRIEWVGSFTQLLEQPFYKELTLKFEKKQSSKRKISNESIEDAIEKDMGLIKKLSSSQKSKSFSEPDSNKGSLIEVKDELIKETEELLIKKESIKQNEDQKLKEKKEVKRITSDEDREEGSVSLEIYSKFIKYNGGYSMFFLISIVMLIWQGTKAFSDIWIVIWQENLKKGMTMKEQWINLGIYAAFGI